MATEQPIILFTDFLSCYWEQFEPLKIKTAYEFTFLKLTIALPQHIQSCLWKKVDEHICARKKLWFIVIFSISMVKQKVSFMVRLKKFFLL